MVRGGGVVGGSRGGGGVTGVVGRAGRVTAPRFADNPARWGAWYVVHGAHVYGEFRRLCLDMLGARPATRLSADQVLHVVRWNSQLRAEGDLVAINNNASALFARLFVAEFPRYAEVFERRRSVWDDLTALEWDSILVAFERTRKRRWPA